MRLLILLQCVLLVWMCFLVADCHGGSPGEGRYQYLRSMFRRSSSLDSTTTGSQDDVNVDHIADTAPKGLRPSRSSQMRTSHDVSRFLAHPDPTPTMLTRDERYSYDEDDYLDQVADQITESPGLFSNNNHRFEDDNLAFSDIYSDDDDEYDDHDGGSFLPQGLFGRTGRTSATETAANRDNNPATPSLQTPVVYRYYSRNRARDVADGSIPFIFLGPNVDHWKVAGKELAARGFSVMAVERVRDEPDSNDGDYSSPGYDANLILGLLEALKWHRVVLVACDSESALAIRAAMELAPDRVVGLVLCGNLQAADDFVANIYPQNRRLPGSFAVDRFLQSNLRCPFQIVWDGDVPARSYFSGSGLDAPASEPLEKGHRSLVLGGGSAPHRRRPEHFAWVLTRFVEEKIAPSKVSRFKVPRARARGGQQTLGQQGQKPSQAPKNSLLLSLSELVSPGSLVVWGRVAASALFYSTMVKIAFFQYESVRGGFITINTGIEMVSRLRMQIVGFVPSFLGSLGSLSFLSRGRDKSRDDTEVEPEVTELSRPSETEKEGEEEEQLLVSPPISEDEEEQSSAPSPLSDDEEEQSSAPSILSVDEEEQSSAPPSPSTDDEEENHEESSDAEEMEKEEGPAKAPDFKPSFFLDHVIV
jgi:pimeloyl-ACP methyl ester carboxylesterase